MNEQRCRTERDSMGELQVPAEALWGAQTQRAVENFPISQQPLPARFIHALGLVKCCCAQVNGALGLLEPNLAEAIQSAALEVAAGRYDAQFPVDVFQTGSGTSTNMNANEVIARLASERLGIPVHPNDHVNLGQSSNDVIPTTIHVSACLLLYEELLPALDHLASIIENRAEELDAVVTNGRTHLMDAMPVRMGQVLGAWANQVRLGQARLVCAAERLQALSSGGTAVGTGINAHPQFGARVVAALAQRSGVAFVQKANLFEGLSAQDAAVEMSGQLKTMAVAMMKISNDLRWMASGPLAGLGEITLPAVQPGSSIMPGKVNPVIPEAVAMVAAQVIGNDATITIAGQAGNFQLNVMLPLIADNLLRSMSLLANAGRVLADKAMAGFTVNHDNLQRILARNPVLVTALNPIIGYERGAAIAKRAYLEGRPILDVAREETDLGVDDLKRLLDPLALTRGGIPSAE